MVKFIEISPGLLLVFYEEREEKWVEIASNYNLTCFLTPECQKGRGNVFMPLEKFLAILDSAQIRTMATEC